MARPNSGHLTIQALAVAPSLPEVVFHGLPAEIAEPPHQGGTSAYVNAVSATLSIGNTSDRQKMSRGEEVLLLCCSVASLIISCFIWSSRKQAWMDDIQPYFDHNVFLNEPYSYYWWSTRNPSKLLYKKFLTEGPEIVVLEWRFRDFPGSETIAEIPLAQQLTSLGYRNTHTFCGGVVRPGRAIQEWECDLIYQPERPR